MKAEDLNDYLTKESKGEHTEFRVVVWPNGRLYAHVLGRDCESFDAQLWPDYINPNPKKVSEIDLKGVLKEVNKNNKEFRDSFKNPDMNFRAD